MSDVLHVDVESRSAVDLKKCGSYVYFEDETTNLWCVCYALGDGPVETWRPGQSVPTVILDHVMSDGVFAAHNSAFERGAFHYILTPRYGWPEPDVTQWRCTMVQAYAMALPGALDDAAAAVGLDYRKDAAGKRLMLQMSKPRKRDPLTWWDDPTKIERLIEYCKTDVEVERALMARLRPLKESELALWHLDQQINDRGIAVDETLCQAAKKIVKAEEIRLDNEMSQVTGGSVTACSNRNEIVRYIRERGLETESIKKDLVEEYLLNPDLLSDVRRVLELRQEAAKASVAKIDALLKGRSPDGRARGLCQFHAASTGRWAGRRFQPHNIIRPDEEYPIDLAIDALLGGWMDLFSINHLHTVSQCLRGMMMADDGNKILAVDYKNIEGRVLAWLAGEQWKMDAFAAFDRGEGPDLYKVAYARSYNMRTDDVSKPQRQIGKVMELALGYQGGVGAFKTMGVNYGVDLPDAEVEEIRDGWRAAHPNIRTFWYDLERAAIDAVERPGTTQVVRDIVFRTAGSFLFMRLPSKRFLAYPYPAIRPKLMPWTTDDGKPVWKDSLTYMSTIDVAKRSKIVDDPQNTPNWARIAVYGGLLVENCTQATARDILAGALPRLEQKGYETILTVHDEVVCETPVDFGSVEEMVNIMCDLPEWAAGCPISADGWSGDRYRK